MKTPLLPYLKAHLLEAGVDEVGRGCLAGPVVAAAVIFANNIDIPLLTDSKKLSERQRDDLIPLIKEQATAYAIASASHEEIDEINILQASFLAMHRAIEKLPIKPEHLLIDGNRFKPYEDIPYECIIKGDGKYLSIAAASILAKDYRDRHMRQLALEYPQYAWERNVGYATKAHKTAIEEYGRCIHHRKSFLFKEEKERLIKQEKLFGD